MRRPGVQLFLASALMLFTELVPDPLERRIRRLPRRTSRTSSCWGASSGSASGSCGEGRHPICSGWFPLAPGRLPRTRCKATPVTIDRSGGDLVYFGALVERGLPVWVMLPLVFLASAAIMAMIAQGVADRFARVHPLEAYRLDVVGEPGRHRRVLASLPGRRRRRWSWGVVIVGLSAPLVASGDRSTSWPPGSLVAVTALATFQGPTVVVSRTTASRPCARRGPPGGQRANGVPHQSIEEVVGEPAVTTPYAFAVPARSS